MMVRQRNTQSGTSLLEVMVALAVMAFIALILASGLGTAARVLGRSTDLGSEIDHAVNRKQVRDWIETASQSAFPGKTYVGLSGSSSQLIVEVLPLDGLFWAGEPMIVTIFEAEDGTVVVRAAGMANRTEERAVEFDLSQTNAGLSISYFGRTSADVFPQWHSEWKTEYGLPALVKLVSTNGEAEFPPLVVKPAKTYLQREMSLSSLLPPIRPSRP